MKLLLLIFGTLVLAGCTTYRGSGAEGKNQTLYNVRGHQMHLMVEGKGPTVILSGGGGVNDPHVGYTALIAELTPHATVALYERAGYGLSEPATSPRAIDTVVEELDDLFVQAKLPQPFVLVGHSMASLELLRYAQVYPEKVKALVLLEGAPPRYYLTMTMPSDFEQGLYTLFFGLAQGNALEVKSLVDNARRVIDSGPLGSIPILYFYAGSNGIPGWADAQKEFAQYSRETQAILIPEANHFIFQSHAQSLAAKIRQTLE